jgi:hypothetical protein
MKRRMFVASLALAALAVVGLAGSAAAGEQVPFTGRLEGVVTRGLLHFPYIDILVEGAGEATQIGQFAFLFPHTVHIPTRTASGTYHIVAANGDRLTATGTGVATDAPTPGFLFIVETLTIDPDARTGRFAGATGSFTVERLYDGGNPGLTFGSFAGTISSPGSDYP